MSERPSDEQPRVQPPYARILQDEISLGLAELGRQTSGLFVSALSAGLDMAFGPFLMAVVLTLVHGQVPEAIATLMVANMYSVGFIFVVLGRTELFTEHTARAMLPVLAGRASVRKLLRLWSLVLVGNLAGGACGAWLMATVGVNLGVIEVEAVQSLIDRMVGHSAWAQLLGAVLAGWMMGLMSWLVISTKDVFAEVFFVWLVSAGIGVAHLPHCVAGSIEVLMGVFLGVGGGPLEFARFLLIATVGNVLGGVFFVAIIKYSHASRTRRVAE